MVSSAIREALTEKEINDCLKQVLQTLPAEDQENIKRVQKRLIHMRGVGPASALQLIFAMGQAPALAQLNKVLKGG